MAFKLFPRTDPKSDMESARFSGTYTAFKKKFVVYENYFSTLTETNKLINHVKKALYIVLVTRNADEKTKARYMSVLNSGNFLELEQHWDSNKEIKELIEGKELHVPKEEAERIKILIDILRGLVPHQKRLFEAAKKDMISNAQFAQFFSKDMIDDNIPQNIKVNLEHYYSTLMDFDKKMTESGGFIEQLEHIYDAEISFLRGIHDISKLTHEEENKFLELFNNERKIYRSIARSGSALVKSAAILHTTLENSKDYFRIPQEGTWRFMHALLGGLAYMAVPLGLFALGMGLSDANMSDLSPMTHNPWGVLLGLFSVTLAIYPKWAMSITTGLNNSKIEQEKLKKASAILGDEERTMERSVSLFSSLASEADKIRRDIRSKYWRYITYVYDNTDTPSTRFLKRVEYS